MNDCIKIKHDTTWIKLFSLYCENLIKLPRVTVCESFRLIDFALFDMYTIAVKSF